MTEEERRRLYRAGKVEGLGEMGLMMAILHVWFGGDLPPTSWPTLVALVVVGLLCVWYGVKTKHTFVE